MLLTVLRLSVSCVKVKEPALRAALSSSGPAPGGGGGVGEAP